MSCAGSGTGFGAGFGAAHASARSMCAGVVALAAAGCSTPVPQITLGLAKPPSQSCPADCADVPLPCHAVMSIRVVDQNDADHPVKLEQCVTVPPDNNYDVCSLNRVDLDAMIAIPVKDLIVQIAVFPGAMVTFDGGGKPVCPEVKYSAANNLPVEWAQAPALGGQAFYHPGDSIVNVVLGCTDLSSPQSGQDCKSPVGRELVATVDDFHTRVPVTKDKAEHLDVSVGEPHSFDGGYVLNPRDTVSLDPEDDAVHWVASEKPKLTKNACVEVREDVPESVSTLHCTPVTDPLAELKGMRIGKDRLGPILKLIGETEFPPEGLTVGMVIDSTDTGVAEYTVKTNGPGSVVYMSDMGVAGGNMTSTSGIFVSRDAPFGTVFSASGKKPTLPAVGGLVAGKITVVFVPFAPPK